MEVFWKYAAEHNATFWYSYKKWLHVYEVYRGTAVFDSYMFSFPVCTFIRMFSVESKSKATIWKSDIKLVTQGKERYGRLTNHNPPPSSAEVKEIVELYVCFLSVPLW
jgi:hypothetical protein